MAGIVGNYRIIRKIGEGGMGTVYVAEHTLIGRQAAIKVLQREMSHRQDLVTRFFNEARAATAVKHPGIVDIYDFGYHTDGSAYIVMEYLEGETLSARLNRSGPLPVARAAALGRQVAGALGAAHAKGIVHRDLKPDNIFIVRDPDIADGERTKILDFGIAKLATGDWPGASKTRTGLVLGTPAYMSPEQSKGAGNVDARTDLYALGCILFEILCGRPPFIAEGGGEVMAQHIYAPVPAPSSIASVTPQVEQFLLRALAKEPAHRFQSAEEMSAALQAVVPTGSFPHAGTPPVTPQHAPLFEVPPQQTTLSAANMATRVGTPSRRPGWIAPVVAVVAIAGVAAVIAISQRGEGDVRAVKSSEPTSSGPEPQPPPPRTHVPEASVSPAVTASGKATLPAPAPITPPAAPNQRAAAPIAGPAAKTPAHVTIKLASEPRGADVYRMPQDIHIGSTPLTYSMDAVDGEVLLIVKKRGYVDQKLAVPADHDTDQTVALARMAAARPHELKPAAPESASASPVEPTSGTLDPKHAGPESGSASPAEPKSGTLDPFDKLPPKPGKR